MQDKINQLSKQKIPFIFIIDFEIKKPVVIPLNKTKENNIFYRIGKHSNVNETIEVSSLNNKKIIFDKYPVSFKLYNKAYNHVIKNLRYGNSYLLNLTFPTKIGTTLSLKEIFYMSHAPYKLLYKDQFTVFSPESFVKIESDQISSYPMKGTIDASIVNAREKILSDKKEAAEHATIVDLIRNDLSKIAKNVTVEKYRYIDHITTNRKNLLQVSSKITGQLPKGYHENLGNIIYEMLPAGSISGAPKKKTVEIIKEAETYNRGYYTGITGIFDGYNLDSFVMIRFIEKDNNQKIFKSGGGITAFSNPYNEYHEMIDKVYLPFI